VLLYTFIHCPSFGARTLAKVAQYDNVLVPENWQRVQRPWCRTCKETPRAFINKDQSPFCRFGEVQIGEQVRHAPGASEINLQPSSRSLTAQVMNPCREHQFAEGWFGPCTVHTLEPLHKHQAGHSSLGARRGLKVSSSYSTQISFRSAQSEVLSWATFGPPFRSLKTRQRSADASSWPSVQRHHIQKPSSNRGPLGSPCGIRVTQGGSHGVFLAHIHE
jgi:hypothetical protein